MRLAKMYQRILTFAGHSIELAHDGEQGMQKIQSSKPDAILLDIMMPKINGIQLLEKLKADPNFKNIPVIMLSSLSDEKQLDKAMELGASRYIRKGDTDPQEVASIVSEVFSGNKTADRQER